jgi:hypothetical protein
MPLATTGKRLSITRPEVTRRLHTMRNVARGHVIHGRGHAEEAVKAHLEEHGKEIKRLRGMCPIFARRGTQRWRRY